MKEKRMFWTGWAVFLMVLMSSGPSVIADTSSTEDNFGMGKLEIRSQAIGQSLRLTLPMLVPGDITEGYRSYLGMTWTNVWANDEEFLLDYEMLDTFLAVGYGFDKRWGMALCLDNRSYFGGAMDGFIEGFHDLFGIDQDGRDEAPSGRNTIVMYDSETGEKIAELSASDLSNTGANLLLNYNIDFGHPLLPSMNIYGVMRYELESAKVFTKSNRIDYGLGVGLSKRWFRNWYTYGVLGYTWYADRGRTSPGNVQFTDEQFTGLFALAWQYSPNLGLMAQYLYCDAAIKTLRELNKPSHEIHLGFKYRISSTYMIDFALIENIITMDNSPDFGIHLGLSIGI
jgi:hypothetical protein